VKLYLADLSPSSMSNFFLKNTTFPSWNTRVFSITVSEIQISEIARRTDRENKEKVKRGKERKTKKDGF